MQHGHFLEGHVPVSDTCKIQTLVRNGYLGFLGFSGLLGLCLGLDGLLDIWAFGLFGLIRFGIWLMGFENPNS